MYFGIDDIFHFSTEGNGFNRVKSDNEEYILEQVETVSVLSKEGRVLVLTRDPLKSDYLYGFDLEGNLIFKVMLFLLNQPVSGQLLDIVREQVLLISCFAADSPLKYQ